MQYQDSIEMICIEMMQHRNDSYVQFIITVSQRLKYIQYLKRAWWTRIRSIVEQACYGLCLNYTLTSCNKPAADLQQCCSNNKGPSLQACKCSFFHVQFKHKLQLLVMIYLSGSCFNNKIVRHFQCFLILRNHI